MTLSLHTRLVLAASLVLVGFMGLTGLALDQAFGSAGDEALREGVRDRVYALLAAAEEDAGGRLRLPHRLTDPRFNRPGSGYYAQVSGPGMGWRSASLLGSGLDLAGELAPGEEQWLSVGVRGESLLVLRFGVAWELMDGTAPVYTFSVAQSLAPLHEQRGWFRRTLLWWLGGASILLLLAQIGVLRWGIRPLRQVSRDLRRMEQGTSEGLGDRYPRELLGLTRGINSLLRHLRAREERYRLSMQDLAHSLKSPLATLRAGAESEPDPIALRRVLDEQVARMDAIVQHQLGRASGSGRSPVGRRIELAPLVDRLFRSLQKVYADKGLRMDRGIDPGVHFQGDEADLMEVLGNVLDNACRYAAGAVRVSAGFGEDELCIAVDDDGPGIPGHLAAEVLQRGRRADQRSPGQGIGLAVADEIVRLYGGRLVIHPNGGLGGARVDICLPVR